MSDLICCYVYLGNEIPNYAISNMENTAKQFPDQKFILISDRQQTESRFSKEIENLSFVYFSKSDKFDQILDHSNHDLKFRSGFWDYTLRRLFVMLEYHSQIPDSKLLHIESDVILFSNFPWEKFYSLKTLAWTKHGENLDSAALLFSPSAQFSSKLRILLESFVSSDPLATDMSALAEATKILTDDFTYLPTQPTDDYFAFFNGVFDALTWGSYITGVDPRNTYGATLLRNSKSFRIGETKINGDIYNYRMLGNNLLISEVKSGEFPIFNLHIHSKNLKLFESDASTEMTNIVSYHTNGRKFYYFSLRLLLHLIVENYHKDSLLSYLLSIPLIKQFRKKRS